MSSLYLPDVAETGMLTRLTLQDLVLKLYKNDVIAGLSAAQLAALTETSFTEANFTGYTSKTLTGGSWTITASEPSFAAYAQQTFTATAGVTTQTIYGFYYTTTGNSLRGFKHFDAPITITTAGDAINITPRLTLTNSEDVMPTGSIIEWPTATAPAGYLLCDGSAVSRTTYATLFGTIGTTFGSGDGSTTFNVPDFRGRHPLGKAASGTGSTLGGTGGAIDHTHGLTSGYAKGFTGTNFDFKNKLVSSYATARRWGTGTVTATASSNIEGIELGGTTDAANAPFLAVNFIIKT